MAIALPYGIGSRTVFSTLGEQLTGAVHGLPASDLEERIARAADKYWVSAGAFYVFRQRIAPLAIGGFLEKGFYNMPGELEVDYLFVRGGFVQPVDVTGEIGHFVADWQRTVDAEKEARVNYIGRRMGWMPLIRLPDRREELYMLASQEMADATLRRILPV